MYWCCHPAARQGPKATTNPHVSRASPKSHRKNVLRRSFVPVFYFQGGLLRHRHTDIRHRLRARPSRPMERTKRAATWKLIRFQHMHCLVNSPDKLKVKSLARLILQSAGRSWHRFSGNALAAACPWEAQSSRSAATPLANHSSNSWVVPLRGPTPMALKGTFPGCSRSM